MQKIIKEVFMISGEILQGGVIVDLLEPKDNCLELIIRDGRRTDIKPAINCDGVVYLPMHFPRELRDQIRFPRSMRRSCDGWWLFEDAIWLAQEYLNLSYENAVLSVAGGLATWIPEAFSEPLVWPIVTDDAAQAMAVFSTFCRRAIISSESNVANALPFHPTVFLSAADDGNFDCSRIVFSEIGKAVNASNGDLPFSPLGSAAKKEITKQLLEEWAAALQPAFQCYRIEYFGGFVGCGSHEFDHDCTAASAGAHVHRV
jgi:hypothetical protein